jgi:hypothetical protein
VQEAKTKYEAIVKAASRPVPLKQQFRQQFIQGVNEEKESPPGTPDESASSTKG